MIGDTRSSLVKQNTFNELSVVAIGTEMTFYLNKTNIGTISDDRLKQGNFGFITSANSTIETEFEFDDFELRVKP